MTSLLELTDISKDYPVHEGGRRHMVRAVSEVSLSLAAGETLGLVGESGCGKTTLGRIVVRLLTPSGGSVRFDGADVFDARGAALSGFRRRVQMVFQDPFSSLDPRMTVRDIVAEPLHVQRIGTRASRRRKVDELLELVGISPENGGRMPGAFSGGQRQRISIARALALEPELLVLDEPVSALDVSIQAQVLNVLQELRKRLNLAFIFISHDLGVIRHVCDTVAVMYLGRIVETGTVEQIFAAPAHPYTRALLSAVPRVEPDRPPRIVLEGDVPDPSSPPSGCPFRNRCWQAAAICAEIRPELAAAHGIDHPAACHFPLREPMADQAGAAAPALSPQPAAILGV
jgi:oligopeptide/dipeptide ABC transporter ATP-binding protein